MQNAVRVAGGGVAAPGGGEGGDGGGGRAGQVAPGGVPGRGGGAGEWGGGGVEAGRDGRRRGQPRSVWHAAVRSLPVRPKIRYFYLVNVSEFGYHICLAGCFHNLS